MHNHAEGRRIRIRRSRPPARAQQARCSASRDQRRGRHDDRLLCLERVLADALLDLDRGLRLGEEERVSVQVQSKLGAAFGPPFLLRTDGLNGVVNDNFGPDFDATSRLAGLQAKTASDGSAAWPVDAQPVVEQLNNEASNVGPHTAIILRNMARSILIKDAAKSARAPARVQRQDRHGRQPGRRKRRARDEPGARLIMDLCESAR
jgi:hypothetical protein